MPFFVASGWVVGTTLILFAIASLVTAVDIVSSVACQAAAYLLGLFLILRVHAPDVSVRAFLAIRRTHVAFYPIAVLLGAAAEAPALSLYEFIERRYPSGPAQDSAFDMLTTATMPKRVLAGVMIIALGPMLEEIFFRGALFKPLERKYADARSIVIGLTAVLFAAVHFDRRAVIHLALVGLVLGLLRQLSGSIFPSLLVHSTFNAVAFYFLVTMPADAQVTPPGWLVAASLFAIAALIAAAYLVSTRTQAAARAQELDRQ
jgi:uncharacterized protein